MFLIVGEWLCVILVGVFYLLILLFIVLMCICVDGEINVLCCVMFKFVLICNLKMEVFVVFDFVNMNKGYVFGWLFVVYEEV